MYGQMESLVKQFLGQYQNSLKMQEYQIGL